MRNFSSSKYDKIRFRCTEVSKLLCRKASVDELKQTHLHHADLNRKFFLHIFAICLLEVPTLSSGLEVVFPDLVINSSEIREII